MHRTPHPISDEATPTVPDRDWIAARKIPNGTTGRSIPVRAPSPLGAAVRALEILGEGQGEGRHTVIVYASNAKVTDPLSGRRHVVTVSVELS